MIFFSSLFRGEQYSVYKFAAATGKIIRTQGRLTAHQPKPFYIKIKTVWSNFKILWYFNFFMVWYENLLQLVCVARHQNRHRNEPASQMSYGMKAMRWPRRPNDQYNTSVEIEFSSSILLTISGEIHSCDN